MPRFLLLSSVVFLVAVGSISLRAQVGHLTSTPPLGDAFPLTETPDGVHVKFPVLLNDRAVIQPADKLRLVYVDPNAGLHLHGGSSDHTAFSGKSLHHRDLDAPDSKETLKERNEPFADSDTAPNSKKIAAEAGSESWKDAQPFREALNQAADIGTTLVYAVPGKARAMSEPLDLPNGMLLGNPEGHIVVLALLSGTDALQAGVQPRDELRSVNGQPVPATLDHFVQFYRAATEQARAAGQASTLEVWRPGESRTLTISIGAPPSIPKMF